MSAVGLGLLGAAVGLLTGRFLRGRQGRQPHLYTEAATPHLLPDPALEWLRRAVGARGAWAIESKGQGAGTRTYQSLDPSWSAGEAELELIERRLLAVAARDGEGTERMDSGLLVTAAAGGVVAAVLLPPDASAATQQAIREDLGALLDGIGRRPVLHDLAQVRDGQSIESVESVGMRLAYQVERVAGAEAYVVVAEEAGARVIGVSGLADRRMLGQHVPEEAPLARVARGAEGDGSSSDPLGGLGVDRRRHPPAQIDQLRAGGDVVGAVAWRVPDGSMVSADAIREVSEALRAAAPRLQVAVHLATQTEQATRDPLTGLYNRRGLTERMGLLGPERGTLISLDYDKFKLLNDALGHAAGDSALVHLARLLTDQVRGVDAAARVGGEEFLLWLPGTSLEEGVRIAERIRTRLGTTPWDWQGRAWPLSASFGVAGWPETTRSRDNLATQADAALYAAKRSGRDRVVTWSTSLNESSN